MGTRLLLADDSITIQKVVGIIFASEDYQLVVADNGIAALEKARALVPDIALVDVIMPGRNGYEVCVEIRRDPALRHVPILLMTGAFEPFDEEKARQSGADDFISKPFESHQLVEKVKQLVGLGQERKASIPVNPPAAIATEPASPIEDDIWAELSSAQTEVSSVSAPVADEAEEFFFDLEEGDKGAAFTGTEPSAPNDVFEVTPEDDLWGAFELEGVDEGESAEFDATLEDVAAVPAGELAVDEGFSFVDKVEPGLNGVETQAVAAQTAGAVVEWEPVEEEVFSFEENAGADEFTKLPPEEPAMGGVFDFAEADAGMSVGAKVPAMGDAFEFSEAVDESIPTAPGVIGTGDMGGVFDFAAESVDPAFSAAGFTGGGLSVEPAMPAALPPAATGEPALSEEQLAAIVTRISRDIIEKIAWEVVPDLAETLIREEIRKIKEGR